MIAGGTILVPAVSTRYRGHPGSNVGKVTARAMGRQRTVRVDQAQGSGANHEAAVRALVAALLEDLATATEVAELGVEMVDSNDSGTARVYRVTRATS